VLQNVLAIALHPYVILLLLGLVFVDTLQWWQNVLPTHQASHLQW
jgi:hypothetical protein